MQRRRRTTPKEPKPERRQIGCKLNSALWTQVKILALQQGRTAGELLEEAMQQYLERHGKEDSRKPE